MFLLTEHKRDAVTVAFRLTFFFVCYCVDEREDKVNGWVNIIVFHDELWDASGLHTFFFFFLQEKKQRREDLSHQPLLILRVVSLKHVFIVFASCERVLLDWCLSLSSFFFLTQKHMGKEGNKIFKSTKNLAKSLEGERKESCQACVGNIPPWWGGWTMEDPGPLLGCGRCTESRTCAAAGSIRLTKLVTIMSVGYDLFFFSPIIFPCLLHLSFFPLPFLSCSLCPF